MLREDRDTEGQESLDAYLEEDETRSQDDPEQVRRQLRAMGGDVD